MAQAIPSTTGNNVATVAPVARQQHELDDAVLTFYDQHYHDTVCPVCNYAPPKGNKSHLRSHMLSKHAKVPQKYHYLYRNASTYSRLRAGTARPDADVSPMEADNSPATARVHMAVEEAQQDNNVPTAPPAASTTVADPSVLE